MDQIGHFYTADNPGRNDLDETQELYYPPILRAIVETDYDGYVGQEGRDRSAILPRLTGSAIILQDPCHTPSRKSRSLVQGSLS